MTAGDLIFIDTDSANHSPARPEAEVELDVQAIAERLTALHLAPSKPNTDDGAQWIDKPHRLLYDAIAYARTLLSQHARLTERVRELEQDAARWKAFMQRARLNCYEKSDESGDILIVEATLAENMGDALLSSSLRLALQRGDCVKALGNEECFVEAFDENIHTQPLASPEGR